MSAFGGRHSAFANVAASQTDAVLVTAVANRAIVVLALIAVNGDTAGSTIVLNSKGAGAGAAITATFDTAANGSVVLPEADGGWVTTLAGEGLTVTTGIGAASNVAVQVVYRLVVTP